MDNIPTPLRWVVLLLVLALVGFLLFRSGLFGSSSDDLPLVTYRVSGSASISLITYTAPDGTATEPDFQSLPWSFGPFRYDQPTMVVLTAHNSSQFGSVVCEILLDGRVWKRDEVKNPDLNASCGGYVR